MAAKPFIAPEQWRLIRGKMQAPGKQVFPAWARALSLVFICAAGLLLLAVPFTALGLIDHVVNVADKRSIWTFFGVALLCLLVALALDLARGFALQNLSAQHADFAARGEAGFGLFLTAFLAFIHPALVAGIVAMALISLCAVVLFRAYPVNADFLAPYPREVRSLLTGRDSELVFSALRKGDGVPPLLPPILRFGIGAAFLVAMAVGAALAVAEVITLGGMVAGALVTFQVGMGISGFARNWFSRKVLDGQTLNETPATFEEASDAEAENNAENSHRGLWVSNLTVRDQIADQELLAPLSFEVSPGKVIGLTGDAGGGKSLLLKSMLCPVPKPDLQASGRVLFDGRDLRQANGLQGRAEAVLAPTQPILLPGSALQNILCFDETRQRSEAVTALARMDVLGIFAEKILDQADVFSLSESQAQIVSLTRAFGLGARVILLDQPETHLTPRAIKALMDMIHVETGLGTTFLIATNHHDLLRRCDELLILEDGFLTDRGDVETVLARRQAGWSRITVARDLSEQPRLHRWLQSHFRRRSDQDNLRYARLLVSELLALACLDDGNPDETVSFDFRHIKHACNIVLRDQGEPISSAQLQQADQDSAPSTRLIKSLRAARMLAAEFEMHHETNEDGKSLREVHTVLELDDARQGIFRKREAIGHA